MDTKLEFLNNPRISHLINQHFSGIFPQGLYLRKGTGLSPIKSLRGILLQGLLCFLFLLLGFYIAAEYINDALKEKKVIVSKKLGEYHSSMKCQSWLVAILGLGLVEANPDAKRLYDDLLSNYNRLIRPVVNHTQKVTVKLGLRLSQLVDLVSSPLLFLPQIYW